MHNEENESQSEKAAFDPQNPDGWHTGNAPMTEPQARYLKTLCEQAKEEFVPELTKAQASKRIEELKRRRHPAQTGTGGSV
jgi:hypothetical protein